MGEGVKYKRVHKYNKIITRISKEDEKKVDLPGEACSKF